MSLVEIKIISHSAVFDERTDDVLGVISQNIASRNPNRTGTIIFQSRLFGHPSTTSPEILQKRQALVKQLAN